MLGQERDGCCLAAVSSEIPAVRHGDPRWRELCNLRPSHASCAGSWCCVVGGLCYASSSWSSSSDSSSGAGQSSGLNVISLSSKEDARTRLLSSSRGFLTAASPPPC